LFPIRQGMSFRVVCVVCRVVHVTWRLKGVPSWYWVV
jgi:hypothetical protein